MMQFTKRHFEIVNSRQVILLVIPPIFLALATFVVGFRWHTRKTKRINTVVEDVLCLCSLAMCLLVTVLVLVLVLGDGQGMSTSFVREKLGEAGVNSWLRIQFILDVCWALSVAVVQLFLLQFYKRLYNDCRHLIYLTHTMMVSVGAWFIYTIIAWGSHCKARGDCRLPTVKTCIIVGSIHVAINLIVMGMAVPSAFRVHMPGRIRLLIAGIFVLGTFCTFCAIFRMECCLVEIFGDYNTDPISASWGRMLFSPLEIAVGIIACSVPTLAPFDKYWAQENIMLGKLGHRPNSSASSLAELKLNPANWGKTDGQVSTFVTIGGREARMNVIKVTKEYDIGHRT